MRARVIRHAVLLVVACALPPARAHATLIASESFAGSPGALAGQNSGTGWQGAWITGQSAVFQVLATDLGGASGSAGGSLLFDGSKASSGVGARAFRAIDLGAGSAALAAGLVDTTTTRYNGVQPSLGRVGTTVWLAAVFHAGTAGNGIAGVQYLDQIHLYDGVTTTASALSQGDNNKDGEALAIGRGNGNVTWNYERTCAHDNCPSGATSSSGYVSAVTMDSLTHWVVMRFVFVSTATTQVTMWLDPAPGLTDPADAAALSLGGNKLVNVTGIHFNWVELGGQTARFSFDEVRLASTFAEVAYAQPLAVPVPGASRPSLALAAGPNPFTSRTTVWFDLGAAEFASVRVVDVAGRAVRDLGGGSFTPGHHAVEWDGRGDHGVRVAAGVYFVRLVGNGDVRLTRVLRLP